MDLRWGGSSFDGTPVKQCGVSRHARVSGNATLFDGSTIETATAPSQIHLEGGPRLRLAAETRARIYHNKLVLESGFGQLEAAPGYEVEARTLHITAASPGTVTRIRLAADRNVVVVAAVQSPPPVGDAARPVFDHPGARPHHAFLAPP